MVAFEGGIHSNSKALGVVDEIRISTGANGSSFFRKELIIKHFAGTAFGDRQPAGPEVATEYSRPLDIVAFNIVNFLKLVN